MTSPSNHTSQDDEGTYFTLVFEGDLRRLRLNPYLGDTPFGRPIASGLGNAFDQMDALEALVARLEQPE